MGNKEEGFSTVCSALIYHDRKIAIKEESDGLSLPGGHVRWEYGLPYCVQKRVFDGNGIRFVPRYVNGVTHHQTPTGLEVLNINVTGVATDISQAKKIRWMSTDEALNEFSKRSFRTADAGPLILQRYRSPRAPLDFIQVTGGVEIPYLQPPAPLASTTSIPDKHEWVPHDFVVVGSAIYHHEHGKTPEWAFMECGREEYKRKLSLYGGKPMKGESLTAALKREVADETGGSLKIDPIGLCGIFINKVGEKFSGQPNMYAVNFATVSRAQTRPTEIPSSAKAENKGMYWLTLEQLATMQEERFRTPDTRPAVMIASHLLRQEGVVPFDFVQELIKS